MGKDACMTKHAKGSGMCTIALVRHGETDWNAERRLQGREDTPLNARGKEQARLTGLYLKDQAWDGVVTSPLRRAHDTARIIASHIGIDELCVLEHFVERDFGAASGMTHEERMARFPEGIAPGMESREALWQRVNEGLTRVRQTFMGKRVVLVSHGGVINAVLSMLSGGEIGTGKTVLNNGGISLIHSAGDTWRIEFYNAAHHLNDLA